MPEQAFPNPDQMYDEATSLKEQGDLEGAVKKLREIIVTSPNHVLTHSALAVNLQKLGQKEDAVAHAKKVVELEPEDPFSYTQLSVICQRCGLIREAEDAMAQSRNMQH
ncbi:tetratricopeptide repeat protein [Lacunimicrobium album]|jgi:Flp pilus assembly protein TadD